MWHVCGNSNKCYVNRICWSNIISIALMVAKLCGRTEDGLNTVWYIFDPDSGRWYMCHVVVNISFGGRGSPSVMRVWVVFVDIGSEEAGLS
jgi:hypothetical protein